MTKLEEVKERLECFNIFPVVSSGYAMKQKAGEICKLFPKSADNPGGYAPKPDENRLLTQKEIAFTPKLCGKCYAQSVRETFYPKPERLLIPEEMQKVIYGIPARKPGEDYSRLMEATAEAQLAKDLKFEQARVERIKREIEGFVYAVDPTKKRYEFPKKKDFDLFWQALKKREGIG